MLSLHEERMADHFTKWHIDGLPCAAVIHRFSQPDLGPSHNHPWSFTSFVIDGGYIEQVYQLDGSSQLVHREVGQSFRIEAGHIHRILALPNGGCTTIILPGPPEQKSGFYDFREDGAYHRYWDESEWRKIAQSSRIAALPTPTN